VHADDWVRTAQLAFFVTLSFFRFVGESTSLQPPVTHTVRPSSDFYHSKKSHACPCGYYGAPIKPCTCAPSTVMRPGSCPEQATRLTHGLCVSVGRNSRVLPSNVTKEVAIL
jgi:hypothetical protein